MTSRPGDKDRKGAQGGSAKRQRKQALELLGTNAGPTSQAPVSSPTIEVSKPKVSKPAIVRHTDLIDQRWKDHADALDLAATSKERKLTEEQKEKLVQAIKKKYGTADSDWTEETKKKIDQKTLAHDHYSTEDDRALKILDNFLNDQRHEQEGCVCERNYFLNFYFTRQEGIPFFNVSPICDSKHKDGHDIAGESDGEAKAGGFNDLVHLFLKVWVEHEEYHRCPLGPKTKIRVKKMAQEGDDKVEKV